MADGDFRLVAANGDTIDLNSLIASDTGVQAIAGLTGFGLPQVEVQYQVGAGDGATYRGSRLAPRDIDVPLFLAGTTRAGLRTQANRLASALAGECSLQWEDGGDIWELKVRRVGGGQFTYGTDTDGGDTLQTVVTLRAGDPLWRSIVPFTLEEGGMDDPKHWLIPPSLMGSAKTYPTVRVTGPSAGFTIANNIVLEEATAKLTYTVAIAAGETITVNLEKGTVLSTTVDAEGVVSEPVNRYGKLATRPRFFSLDYSPLGAEIYIDAGAGVVEVDVYKRNWLVI